MICRYAAPSSATEREVAVRIDLDVGNGRPIEDADPVHHLAPDGHRTHRSTDLAGEPGQELAGERRGVDLGDRVQHRQGLHPVEQSGSGLESDRPAGVVNDEVEPVDVECIDGGGDEQAESGQRVVEVRRTIGEAQPWEVERNRPEPPTRELSDHLAVQERRGRQTVQQHDRLSLARSAHEGTNSRDVEKRPCRPVDVDDGGDVCGHVSMVRIVPADLTTRSG